MGMSPPVSALQQVFFPFLNTIGLDVKIDVIKNGFFPDVIGQACIKIPSLTSPLKPIELMERGS